MCKTYNEYFVIESYRMVSNILSKEVSRIPLLRDSMSEALKQLTGRGNTEGQGATNPNAGVKLLDVLAFIEPPSKQLTVHAPNEN